jgi:predicted proteasome-type protease
MHQFEEIKRGDRVIVVIDSVGNLASKKEVEDALKQITQLTTSSFLVVNKRKMARKSLATTSSSTLRSLAL